MDSTSPAEEQTLAFKALLDLAQRSRHSARGLPAQAQMQPHWSGIGFNLLGLHLVAPMGEVAELLELPAFTKLPGVQPWVMGVANVRGRLLPLFDLAMYFNARLEGQRKRHRVLVLESEGIYSGLVVDAALGMQHFPVSTYSRDMDELGAEIKPFVAGHYTQSRTGLGGDKQKWYVFSPRRLLEDPRFVNAAQ